MPPKKDATAAAAGDAGPTLSARDMNLLTLYLQTLPPSAKAQGDWTLVAEKAGLKDEKSARESFRQLCKKYGWFEAAAGGTDQTATAAAPVKTPRKRATPKSKKAAAAAEGNDDGGVPETPTKKQKVEEKKVEKHMEDGDAEMEEFVDLAALAA
ncbi:hypothetical protein Micbo1qcDRAFT_170747 [Microdochium bolleyi]|uniref:Uncharacterized protein n=1 Tax=Microdochium bolleyi TaxID=196109 RepID=A0A136JIL8_9PEZI|nr:hypothetical protein Micbo1qcDRAFT_170747 [Microdochium bolleyi]